MENCVNFFRDKMHEWRCHTSKNRAELWLWGTLFLDDQAISLNELAESVEGALASGSLGGLLSRCNGFFALVHISEHGVAAAVDHMRSRPLFYAIQNGELFLGDCARSTRDAAGLDGVDSGSLEELQLTLFVTGERSLVRGLSQLRGGEYLVWKRASPTVQPVEYFQLRHHEVDTVNEPELIEELRAATRACVQRLIGYANGRSIHVPLSAGLDSRLLVAALWEAGYDNVKTFCFGKLQNSEVEISQKVADALGYPWTFVPYGRKEWTESWGDPDRLDYQRYGSQLASAPVYSDWLAVKRMFRDGVADEGGVFTPGHSGDFLAGSHTPKRAFTQSSFRRCDVAGEIYGHHYNCSPVEAVSENSRSWWLGHIESQLSCGNELDAIGFADEYDRWDWRERQCKYIVNNVRCYEFYGGDWWLPLWDRAFVDFWMKVPLLMRRQRLWGCRQFESYIHDATKGKVDISAPKLTVERLLGKVRRRMPQPIRKPWNRLERWRRVRTQPINALARYAPEEVARLTRQGYSINGIVLYHHLAERERWM